jgi:hypothetical protein
VSIRVIRGEYYTTDSPDLLRLYKDYHRYFSAEFSVLIAMIREKLPALLTAVLWIFLSIYSFSQDTDPLNTAANETYMKDSEKVMIREVNLLRSDPKGYLVYVDQYMEDEKKWPESIGSGQMKYSLTFNYMLVDGTEKLVRIDTVWLDQPESDEQAIESLRKELNSTEPLSILQPDKGIYEAVNHYANDQDRHNWELRHIGSDGSWPWDRIKKYSPGMREGNENIASRFPEPTVRQIVIQLLVDTGIPGYGHRANLLDPRWTHLACYDGGLKGDMYRWIQNFGQAK